MSDKKRKADDWDFEIPPIKRKKVFNPRLTMQQKLEILKKLEAGRREKELADEYEVRQSTISKIKSNKENILFAKRKLQNQNYDLTKRKIFRQDHTPANDAVFDWFKQMRSLSKTVTGDMLCKKARFLNMFMGGPADFVASPGWLCKWEHKYQVRPLTMYGERLSNDEPASASFSVAFHEFVNKHGYTRDCIYNADETGLNWKALPRKTLALADETNAYGRKPQKDRVTVMTCANASGTHKIPLMIIGKSKKPRCFTNDGPPSSIVYRGETSGWMTRQIFTDWYTTVFLAELERVHGSDTSCILLLDNAPSHPPVEQLNALSQRCTVVYLPPNVTALIQPMDQGLIAKMKKLYKRHMLEYLLLTNDHYEVNTLLAKWNILDVCNAVADAWNSITLENIKNAWRKLLGGPELPQVEDTPKTEQFVEWINKVPIGSRRFPVTFTKQEVMDWLVDDDDPGWAILTDEELMDLTEGVIKEIDYAVEQQHLMDEEDSDEDAHLPDFRELPQRGRGISTEKALEGLQQFQKWYEDRQESLPDDLIVLEKLSGVARRIILSEKK